MQDTLIKIAATLGGVAILVAVVGFALLPKDSPSLRFVRGGVIALLVLALIAGTGVGLLQVWS